MLIRKPADIRPSEITSQSNYLNRRSFLKAGLAAGGGLIASPALSAVLPREPRAKLDDISPSRFSTDETPTTHRCLKCSRSRCKAKDNTVALGRFFEAKIRNLHVFFQNSLNSPIINPLDVIRGYSPTAGFNLSDLL